MMNWIISMIRRRILIPLYRPIHRYHLWRWRRSALDLIEGIAEVSRQAGKGPIVLTGIHQHFGDVIMATAVVRHLRARYPNGVILFATQERFRDLVGTNPHIDHVIGCSCVGSLVWLAKHPAIDWHYPLTIGGDLCELCGAVFRDTYAPFVAQGIEYLNWFRQGRHLVDLWMERAGFSVADPTPELYVPDGIRARMRAKLEALAAGRQGPNIMLHTRAPHWPAKQWPFENFVALIKRLAAEISAIVFVIGVEPVEGLPEGTINLTGQTSLLEVGALLGEADLFVGLDSGPAHLASAMGTPSVVLFGPTDPAVCRPRGRRVDALWHGADADGLFAIGLGDAGRDNRDMAKITVDEVFAAAVRLIASPTPRQHAAVG